MDVSKLSNKELEAIQTLSDEELTKLHKDLTSLQIKLTKATTQSIKRINNGSANISDFVNLPKILDGQQESKRLNSITLAAFRELGIRRIKS